MRVQLLRYKGDIVPELAILVMLTDTGTHTGFLYRFEGQLVILDQLWHEQFRVALTNTKEYDFVIPNLEPEERIEVANACHLIVTRAIRHGAQRLKYGFGQPKAPHINKDGEILFGAAAGLTCATFILGVFESVRIPFVELSGWERRAGDDARHEQLLELMQQGVPDHGIGPASPEHVEKMRAELPCIRVRPEEVAAIAMSDDRPAEFDKVERTGRWILERITPGAERASI